MPDRDREPPTLDPEHRERWEDAVTRALQKKRPPEGWPEKPSYGKRGRPKRDRSGGGK